MASVIALVLIGLATGVLAGLLGVGGGIFVVPAMVVGFGIPAGGRQGHVAVGDRAHVDRWARGATARSDNADLRVAVILGFAGVVSAFVAGKISVGMSETTSNILFAILLLVVATRMLWQTRRRPRRAHATGDHGRHGRSPWRSSAVGACAQGSLGFGLGSARRSGAGVDRRRLRTRSAADGGVRADDAGGDTRAGRLDVRGVKWAVIGRVPGSVVGAVAVVTLPDRTLIVVFAVLVLIGVILSVVGWNVHAHARRRCSPPARLRA